MAARKRENNSGVRAAIPWVLIDGRGNLSCGHRKLNELDIGHECYDQGDRLNVVHTAIGTLGLMIRVDGFADEHVLSRSLCYIGGGHHPLTVCLGG